VFTQWWIFFVFLFCGGSFGGFMAQFELLINNASLQKNFYTTGLRKLGWTGSI